jgi:hypothetical protein
VNGLDESKFNFDFVHISHQNQLIQTKSKVQRRRESDEEELDEVVVVVLALAGGAAISET